ncbi:TonB-dependent receptor [Persicobacter psychrovividus]|uniref:SusC/RagA family TonB-linked outer membrane protein n=1 Tax=Persicobacter psychrovividus TaxID=387638 RepID=A0ABM7VLR3_9BACT|nr:SusC/RagA family TonB-linked outer membrane protein [Persicobacter psychrovividus]
MTKVSFTIFKHAKRGICLAIMALLFMMNPGVNAAIRDDGGKPGLNDVQEGFEVSGQVTTSDDFSPGVTVMIKGTTIGTITDFEGKYTLTVNDPTDVLVFSFVGYKTKEVVVGNQKTIDVVLDTDLIQLEELVVVGYGQQKKATLTGAVETIKSEVFESRAVANPALALQGQTPGLNVTRSSSRPGDEGLNISIRGSNSINGDGTPLIIIDGVATLGTTAFTSLNADDIETMSILKDAEAAIYGARASNGVILVTTKKGDGKVKVNISSQLNVNTPSMRFSLADGPQQYANAWLGYGEQDKLAGLDTYYWAWTEDQLNWMARGTPGYMQTPYWGNVWIGDNLQFDDLYGNSFSTQNTASISGGDEKSNFRVSLGYNEEVGPVKPTYDGLKRYNIRSNYNFNVNRWLDIKTSISYFNRNQSGPTYSGFRAFNEIPLFPVTNPYGNWSANFGEQGGGINRMAEMVDGGRRNNNRQELRTQASATFKLLEQLTFTADVALDNAWRNNQQYTSEVPTYSWNNTPAVAKINQNNNYIYEFSGIDRHETYQGIFNYNNKFGKHSINITGGGTAEKRTADEMSAKLWGFEDLGVPDLGMGSVEDRFEIKGGGSNWGLMSLLGAINYDYNNKYLLKLQGRRDGSSKFAKGHKWKNFGSVSGGWVISEENFLKGNNTLSFLKLRAGYGAVGNQGGIGNHDYASPIDRSNFMYFGQQDIAQYLRATANVITTNERTWEVITTQNVGMDFGFLEGKLSGTVELYKMINDGMLIGVTYPSILGGSPKTTNHGKLETKGWEFQIAWRDQIGSDFNYNIGFNISDNNNKLLSMEGKESFEEGLVKQRVGYPLNSYFLYETDGMFSSPEEAQEYYAKYSEGGTIGRLPTNPNTLRAGDIRIIDRDGNGYIDPIGDPSNGDTGDLKFMGDNQAHYTFGIDLGFNYKHWDFSAFFQGVLQQNMYRSGQAAYPRSGHFTNQTTAYDGLTWTPENPNAEFPRVSGWASLADWNYQYTDIMLSNGRYMRLKNLSFGYTFNKEQLKKLNIDRLRLYFTGNDLLTFSSMLDGWDPEYGSSLDNQYPFFRTWAFGLNVTF